MKYLKKLSKSIVITLISVIILTFLFTFLNFFNFISTKTLNIIKIIIPIFSLALGGYIIGTKSHKNGWLEGLKFGVITVVLFIIIAVIIQQKIEIKNLIFYILLILSSTLGSMIGINKK